MRADPYVLLRGNDVAKKTLRKLVAHQNIPHALLFAGPAGVGKARFAQAFAADCMNAGADSLDRHTAKIQTGAHPDLHSYFPETAGGMYTIDTIRHCLKEIELPPFEAPVQFFIFHEAHQMTPVCSNALLKTLEEPSEGSFLILLTDQPEALLPTVISRCRQVTFFPVADEDICQELTEKHGVQPEEAKQIAYLSQGSFARAQAHLGVSQGDLQKQLQELLQCDLCRDYPLFLKIATALEEKIHPQETDLILEQLLVEFQRRRPQIAFEPILKRFEEARLALQRNVRWRVVLEHLFRFCTLFG